MKRSTNSQYSDAFSFQRLERYPTYSGEREKRKEKTKEEEISALTWGLRRRIRGTEAGPRQSVGQLHLEILENVHL